jgi:hypothetical protein
MSAQTVKHRKTYRGAFVASCPTPRCTGVACRSEVLAPAPRESTLCQGRTELCAGWGNANQLARGIRYCGVAESVNNPCTLFQSSDSRLKVASLRTSANLASSSKSL